MANPPTTIHTATVAVAMTEVAAALVVMTPKVHVILMTTPEEEMDVVAEATSAVEEEITGPPIVVVVAQTAVAQEVPAIPMVMVVMMTPNHQRPVPTAPL